MKRICVIIVVLLYHNFCIGQFSEVSSDVGINHLHNSPIMMGGGVTFFDYNNDGFLDIYATDPADYDKLYENFGDGTFFEISDRTNIKAITKENYSFGVIAGDINNDGWDDLFIPTYSKEEHCLLLLNNCDGTFSDISLNAGITNKTGSSGAIFIDVNQDGLLDIYVINYIDEFLFIKDSDGIIIDIDRSCLPNYLYVNQGDNKFLELASDYNVDNLGCGLSVVASDFDSDGDQDIYIANDHGMFVVPNTMYRNNYPEASFTDVSVETGLDAQMFGMGIAVGDWNENGSKNYYLSNIGNNIFYDSNDSKNFIDIAAELNLENGYYENDTSVTSWGTFFLDYDNDTDLDLFVVNGYIRTGFFGFKTTFNDKNSMFQNNGDGTFTDVSVELNLNDSLIGRGGAYVDYDRNGTLDLFIVNTSDDKNGRSLFYKNEYTDNNWVEFDLEGSNNSNRSAFGSLVSVYFNGRELQRELSSGGTHASQHSQILQFGLGSTIQLDSVQIQWPNNEIEKFYEINANSIYYSKQGENLLQVEGCMDPSSSNYNPDASYSTACSRVKVFGCLDPLAFNFNSAANFDDGSCNYNEEEIVLELNENKINNRILLYPNPINSDITVENIELNSEILKIVIYNSNSEIIYKNESWNSTQVKINTSFLANGLYVVKIVDKKNGKVVFTSKIIK